MARKPVPQSPPVTWSQSTGMVGAYLSQLGGLVVAVAGALLYFSDELPRWLQIACAVVLVVAGGGGAVAGRGLAGKRRSKGEDLTQPEPAIRRVVRDGDGFARVGLLAALAGGGLLLLLSSCGPSLIAPGTPAAAQAACETTLAAAGPWFEVARPYLPEEEAIRATEALRDVQAAAPLVCGAIRFGLEAAVRTAAEPSP